MKKQKSKPKNKKQSTVYDIINIIIKAVLIIIAVILIVFLIKNFEKMKNGEMTFKEAKKEIVNISKKINIIKGLKNLKKGQHHKYLDKISPGDKKINTLASKLTYKCSNNNKVCETSKLLSFVSNKIKYRSDPNVNYDYIKPPKQTLEAMSGDCEDQTILLISLLESLGINSYMVFTSDHVYPLVCFKKAIRGKKFMKIENKYCYHLEPTAKGSTIGYHHKLRDIKFIYNSKTKKAVRGK